MFRRIRIPKNRLPQVRTARSWRTPYALSQSMRDRGSGFLRRSPYLPPEDWHEPAQDGAEYRILVQEPGTDYRHVLTPEQIRARLGQLPDWMTRKLEVIQLSRLTRKKQSFPCYGMQWGSALYLYPVETSLVERFTRPPTPAQLNEARLFGGRWEPAGDSQWNLIWTEPAIQDFYLNNVLIHELGHLLDDRNTNHADRERYAEWFAIEYGYRPSRRAELAKAAAKKVVRRHAK